MMQDAKASMYYSSWNRLPVSLTNDMMTNCCPSKYLRAAIQGDLDFPLTRTVTFGSRAFAVSGPICWNALPPSLVTVVETRTVL